MLNFLYTIFIYPVYMFVEFILFIANNITQDHIGLSIIILSLGINLITLPIYNVAEKWQEMERIIQKRMKPKVNDIKAVFKGDERYMILSAYYRQNNYHPLYALRSLFALFIQIPFFIAAYQLLSELPALKETSFLFLKDLGAPDKLINIGSVSLNLLPVIMTVINIAASAVYTKGLELKDKLTLYLTAFLFLILLYNSPSGLVLYWTLNNIFSLFKNIFYKIKLSKKTWFIIAIIVAVSLTIVIASTAGKKKPIFMSVGFTVLLSITPFIKKLFLYFESKQKKSIFDSDKKRFYIFLSAVSAFLIFVGLVIPSTTIASSPQEFANFDNFTNPLGILYYTFIQTFGIFVWLLCLYKLFSKQIQKYFSYIAVFVLMGSLINAFIFTGNYGDINKFLVFENSVLLHHGAKYFILNIFTLSLCILIILSFLYSKFVKFLPSILTIIVISFLTVTGFSGINIYKEYRRLQKTDLRTVINDKAYKVSKTGKNIFIFMLDRSMNFFIDPVFENNSLVKKEYTGFTLFKNALAFGGNTNLSTPSLFGGYEYTPDNMNKRDSELLVKKHNEALSVLPKLFSENGWNVSFTDPSWLNYSWIPDLSVFDKYDMTAKNIDYYGIYSRLFLKNLKIFEDKKGLYGVKRNMLYFSFFRILPSEIRRVFYSSGNYANTMLPQYIKMAFIDSYSALQNIKEEVEFVEDKNCINIIVNNITHEPPKQSDIKILQKEFLIPLADKYCLNEYTAEHFYANYLAHEECAKFFRFLKENNCYDNSRIIIAGDHGRYSMKTRDMSFLKDFAGTGFRPEELIPLMMMKDFNSDGNLKIDNTFMTLADIPFLTVKDLDEKLQINPFTGILFKDSQLKSPAKIMIGGGWQADKELEMTKFKADENDWAFVKEDVYKPENWSHTEFK
ncbi:YidC/Oxa1 family membrane protein insertase [Treponema denticola]|uniref:YidC/Oxa1 family membrane protein insertase n=1 Tax=Treponema denticola TaxID=158 RepID=UPI0002B5EC92|nr:membrane protein insertase YidC [Treponema denticola]EMB21452.1 YidC/Oxa1 family membrane protein insertase [Treponema denticola SP37]EPF32976.1 YidC/Oxa1 family membrane protein insertase [Treponema denticola SP44]EPF40453.1 YidC/Oxa1 family membrane protein insertase [Treponema denticola SP23]